MNLTFFKITASLILWLGFFYNLKCSYSEGGTYLLKPQTPVALKITSIWPDPGTTDIAINPTISVSFNNYLLSSSVKPLSIFLYSGLVRWIGTINYNILTKTITFKPVHSLEKNLRYNIWVSNEITDLFEQRFSGYDSHFFTGAHSDAYNLFNLTPNTFTEYILPIFQKNCACHRQKEPAAKLDLQDQAAFNSIYLGPSSYLENIYLVLPGNPQHSYLLHKLLPEYPLIEGQPMPFASELDFDYLRIIYQWINNEAPY